MRCHLHVHHPLALADILCTCPRRSQVHLLFLAAFPHPLHPLCLALLTEAPRRSSPSDVVDEPPSQAPLELPPRAWLPSSERAPSSSRRVSKHQSAEPPQDRFRNDNEPPTESGSISSTTSTACAPRTSPTQPLTATSGRSPAQPLPQRRPPRLHVPHRPPRWLRRPTDRPLISVAHRPAADTDASPIPVSTRPHLYLKSIPHAALSL
jgi:hypothetical protein